MLRYLHPIDRILRGASVRLLPGVIVVALCGAVYGAVMGAFGGFDGDRPLQILFSAIKVPMLILVTTMLAMPSYFVVNALFGLRNDFGQAFRAVVSTQTAVAIVLAALAPFTALWYASTKDYNEATTFNALMFAVASLAAQWVLRKRYAPLVARNRRHLWMMRAWLVAYAFVGIQMGWTLRPFLGQPGVAVSFFRGSAAGNAYVIVVEIAWKAIIGK
jgi:hypothetical protein